jgi:predicted nucleotidyltransferase
MSPITYPGPLAARRPHVPVPGHLIFQVLAGSRAYGLARTGSDEDWRGVYQATRETLYGLAGPIEHVEFPPDQRYWELTHFGRLCLAGSPHALELLWIPPEMIALDSRVARALREMRQDFLTASTASTYFGFLRSIRRSMAPTKVRIAGQDQVALPSDRQDKLLAGKRGSHLVRVFLNFRDLLRNGEMAVRLEGENLKLVSAIKAGMVPADQVLSLANELERECRALAESHPWPEADSRSLEKLLIRARRGEL